MSIIVEDLFKVLMFTELDALFSYISIALVPRVALDIWLCRGRFSQDFYSRLVIFLFHLDVAATELYPTSTTGIAYSFAVHVF